MYVHKNQTFNFGLLLPQSWKVTLVWEGIVWPPGSQQLFSPTLFFFHHVWKQLNRWCDIAVLQHQSACIYSEAHLRHSLLFSRNMYSQTTFSLHVGVQDQTSIKRQCIRYLGAKGSSSPCPHKHAVKFPASHFKTSTTLQPFAHCPRYFLAFYLHEFGFLWPFK